MQGIDPATRRVDRFSGRERRVYAHPVRLPALLGTLALICFAAVMAGPAGASFPGRNGSIAFTGLCGHASCIKTVAPSGTGEKTVKRTSGADHAHYSPNGKMLVFDRDPGAGCCQIYTVHADGTHLRRITHGFDDEDPAWSPDGKQIVFSRSPKSGPAELFVVDANGKHLHRLTKGAVGGSEPDWSTKGLIAFQGAGQSGNDIFVIKSNGKGEKDLTKGTPAGCGAPSWSPDGKWIAFIGGTDVWRMSARGTEKTDLTNTGSFKDHPAFSPDGKLIVYQDPVSGSNELWVMHANGTGATQITHDSSIDGAPSWQPR